jgi:hypothetical protein
LKKCVCSFVFDRFRHGSVASDTSQLTGNARSAKQNKKFINKTKRSATFAKHFDAIESALFCNGRCKTLATMLRHIAGITASEASAERAFSRLSLMVPKRRRSLLPQSVSMAVRANVYAAAAAAEAAKKQAPQAPRAAAAAAEAAPVPVADLLATIGAIVTLASQKLEVIAGLRGGEQIPIGQAACRFERNGVKCKRRLRAADTADDFKVVCSKCRSWHCSKCVGNWRLVLASDSLQRCECPECRALPKEKWWDVGVECEGGNVDGEDAAVEGDGF